VCIYFELFLQVPGFEEVTLYRLDWYGAFFVVENSSQSKYAQVMLSIPKMDGYMVCTRALNDATVVDCVRAGHR